MGSILFWAVVAALTLAVTALLAAALGRGQAAPAAASDLAVYRDQLAEVERDLARGTISSDEAARLRTEIGRRVLAADHALHQTATAAAGPARGVTLALVALILIGVGVGTYVWRGHPGLGDLPMALRLAEAETNRANRPRQAEAEAGTTASRPAPQIEPRHAELMTELRRVMTERPNDLQGQELLARNEAMLGDFAAAARAQSMVVTLKGPVATADDLAMQAELMITAAGGLVTPEAETVLSAALEKDAANGSARYYSGLLFAQVGRPDLAFRFWAPLWEASTPADPWTPTLQQQLPDLAWLAGQHRYEMPALRRPLRGPDQAAIDAAGEMTPADRQAFIRQMVDGLMDRLANEGGPVEEWAQLLRALGTLGEHDGATAIYAEAQQRFVGRAADLALLRAAATEAGLP